MALAKIRARLREIRQDHWQECFLLFIVIYGGLLMFNLAYKSILWDETPHLYGGLLLTQGRFHEYFAVTFYPPLFDVAIACFYGVFGASVFAGRSVAVVFSVLTLLVLFKLVSRTYSRKVAFLSCVILATMPGFIWVSRMTLLETALEFFLIASLFFFIEWLHTGCCLVVSCLG